MKITKTNKQLIIVKDGTVKFPFQHLFELKCLSKLLENGTFYMKMHSLPPQSSTSSRFLQLYVATGRTGELETHLVHCITFHMAQNFRVI